MLKLILLIAIAVVTCLSSLILMPDGEIVDIEEFSKEFDDRGYQIPDEILNLHKRN